MSPKVALLFLISGNHILQKEHIWRQWIETKEELFSIWFHYTDANKIQSPWIQKHMLPFDKIVPTSYYHIIPAQISLLQHAYHENKENQWFIFVTETCVPIIPFSQFEKLFQEHQHQSILKWKKCIWNKFVSCGNGHKLPYFLHIKHDPWFLLTRKHVEKVFHFISLPSNHSLYQMICQGIIANEMLYTVILYPIITKQGKWNTIQNNEKENICESCSGCDWKRRTSPTSPHLFHNKSNHKEDILFIQQYVQTNPYAMFLRKVDASFPDSLLQQYL